jgi:hypothetical protein
MSLGLRCRIQSGSKKKRCGKVGKEEEEGVGCSGNGKICYL